MILMASCRGDGAGFAEYLKKDAYDFMGAYGTIASDMEGALAEIDRAGKGSRGTKTILQVVISPDQEKSRFMTKDEWMHCVHKVMKGVKMEGQPFVAVREFKDAAWHMHLGIQRAKGGKLLSDSYTAMKLNKIKGELERELGHPITPEYNEQRKDFTRINRQCWMDNDTADGYVKAMKDAGFTVCRNQRRNPFYFADDRNGQTYKLSSHFYDRETKQSVRLSEVFQKLDGYKLPNDKDVIQEIRDRQRMERAIKVGHEFIDNDPTGDPERSKKKHFNSVLHDMKAEGKEATKDEGDPNITATQNRMDAGVKEFQQRRAQEKERASKVNEMKDQGNQFTKPKQESDQDRKAREFKENMLRNLNQDKDRGMDYER